MKDKTLPVNCWRPRALRNRNRPPTQTAGSIKDWNCKRDPGSAHMAKCSRSYKDERYSAWAIKHTGEKHKGKAQVLAGWRYRFQAQAK